MIKRGKFITFEGIDTSGKSTQAKRLTCKLRKVGIKVKLFHFPIYERPLGEFIGKILNGAVNSDIGNDAMQMLYVADQMAFQKELEQYLAEGYTVICDRYDLSTIVYYSMMPGKSLEEAMNIVYGHWQVGLTKPDYTVVFGLQAEEIARRKKSLDKFEKDVEAMTKANESYSSLALELTDRRRLYIDASQSIETIAESVGDSVIEYINWRE